MAGVRGELDPSTFATSLTSYTLSAISRHETFMKYVRTTTEKLNFHRLLWDRASYLFPAFQKSSGRGFGDFRDPFSKWSGLRVSITVAILMTMARFSGSTLTSQLLFAADISIARPLDRSFFFPRTFQINQKQLLPNTI